MEIPREGGEREEEKEGGIERGEREGGKRGGGEGRCTSSYRERVQNERGEGDTIIGEAAWEKED